MPIQNFSRICALAVVLGMAPGMAQGACESGKSETGAVVGTVLGAVVGGLLGSRIGKGGGKKVAIGAGVLAGGFLGNHIGGQMTCEDQAKHEQTTQQALETQPSGAATSWVNPDSGDSGSVTPTRTWQNPDDGKYCREFDQVIEVNGKQETVTSTACREPDGTWRTQAA
jgi:surface antigen